MKRDMIIISMIFLKPNAYGPFWNHEHKSMQMMHVLHNSLSKQLVGKGERCALAFNESRWCNNKKVFREVLWSNNFILRKILFPFSRSWVECCFFKRLAKLLLLSDTICLCLRSLLIKNFEQIFVWISP